MPDQPRGPAARLAATLMLGGSLLLLAIALLTTASVLRRWLTGHPVPGDFELVQMGAGIAVFGFLAHGTLAGSHILVDSFTTWLPQRVQAAIDAAWNLIWGLVALALAWRMVLGTLDSFASDTRSMVLSVPIWPGIGLGALGFLATALAAGLAAQRLLQGRAG